MEFKVDRRVGILEVNENVRSDEGKEEGDNIRIGYKANTRLHGMDPNSRTSNSPGIPSHPILPFLLNL